ncbi:MAG TPA: hypothetical protein VFA04_03350 [Bryobacteraceae bacterium]|nr:hypothetical protein [Bryobacteraceae bacterium]
MMLAPLATPAFVPDIPLVSWVQPALNGGPADHAALSLTMDVSTRVAPTLVMPQALHVDAANSDPTAANQAQARPPVVLVAEIVQHSATDPANIAPPVPDNDPEISVNSPAVPANRQAAAGSFADNVNPAPESPGMVPAKAANHPNEISAASAPSRVAARQDAPAPHAAQHALLVGAPDASAASDVVAPTAPAASKLTPAAPNAPMPSVAPVHATNTPAVQTSAPLREMTFRVGEQAAHQVNVHVVDRGDGNVHIAVRTGNADLSSRIQTDAPKLAESLHDNGFDSELWTPAHDGGSGVHRASESQRDQNRDAGGSGSGAGQQQEQQERQQPQHDDGGEWQDEIVSLLPGFSWKGEN